MVAGSYNPSYSGGRGNSPASASQIAGTTDTHHHAQLIFVFLVETGFHLVDQDGLDLLTSWSTRLGLPKGWDYRREPPCLAQCSWVLNWLDKSYNVLNLSQLCSMTKCQRTIRIETGVANWNLNESAFRCQINWQRSKTSLCWRNTAKDVAMVRN